MAGEAGPPGALTPDGPLIASPDATGETTRGEPYPPEPEPRRALAASMIRTADPAVPPPVAFTLVDLLDAISAAVLRSGAVLPDPTARAILRALWQE